jgi:hypothetical protein
LGRRVRNLLQDNCGKKVKRTRTIMKLYVHVERKTTLILLQIPPDDEHSLAVCIGCHLLDSAITLKTLERIAVLG